MANMLGLLYLASPTLPIGSFAYSQGLEKAIDANLVHDKDSLLTWCRDFMSIGLAQLDVVLLAQIYRAVHDRDQSVLDELNTKVFATREAEELYLEERNLGQSIKRLITTQGFVLEDLQLPSNPSFLLGFAWLAVALELSTDEMKTAFLWSWLENQTAVACKAIPLGQTDAQSILLALRQLVTELISSSDEELFGSLPGQVLLSVLHETQYSRLFRS